MKKAEAEVVVAEEAAAAKPEKSATTVVVKAISLVRVGHLGEEPRDKAPTVGTIMVGATSKAKRSPALTMREFETLRALVNLVNVCSLAGQRSNGVDFAASGATITVPVTLLKKK